MVPTCLVGAAEPDYWGERNEQQTMEQKQKRKKRIKYSAAEELEFSPALVATPTPAGQSPALQNSKDAEMDLRQLPLSVNRKEQQLDQRPGDRFLTPSSHTVEVTPHHPARPPICICTLIQWLGAKVACSAGSSKSAGHNGSLIPLQP